MVCVCARARECSDINLVDSVLWKLLANSCVVHSDTEWGDELILSPLWAISVLMGNMFSGVRMYYTYHLRRWYIHVLYVYVQEKRKENSSRELLTTRNRCIYFLKVSPIAVVTLWMVRNTVSFLPCYLEMPSRHFFPVQTCLTIRFPCQFL